MNTRLLVYRMLKSLQRPELYVRGKILRTKKEIKNGRSNSWDDLDQVCAMWVDMVDIITYAIFCDCRLRGVGVVRGVTLPSPIDLIRCRPSALTTLVKLPCDRVILSIETTDNALNVVIK